MALLALAAAWAGEAGRDQPRPPLFAATVDHGLRPEAQEEGALVAREAGRLGVSHSALTWEGLKPRTGLQDAARDARYALLAEEASRRGATHVVTAHHADDQAETVIMRLVRGSGLDGLAGMAPERPLHGVMLVRPFLQISKARLIATATAAGMPFVVDPSNSDPRFGRTQARRLAAVLAAEGLTSRRLVTLAKRAARAEAALDAVAMQAFLAASAEDADVLLLSADVFRQPDEVLLRVLMAAIRRTNAANAAPLRLERAEALLAEIRLSAGEGRALRRTLGGCVVALDGLGRVTIAREAARSRGLALFTRRKRRTDKV